MSKKAKIPFGSKRQPHIVPMEQTMDSRALAKHHVLERGDSEPESKPAPPARKKTRR